MKKWASAILMLAMLLTGVMTAQASILTKEQKYDALLDRLAAYVNDEGEEEIDLGELVKQFGELKGYECSYSFANYSRILERIEKLSALEEDIQERFTIDIDVMIRIYFNAMRADTKFAEFLEEDGRFGSVDCLENYYLGRMAEEEGNFLEACRYYQEAGSFMDSSFRYSMCAVESTADLYSEGCRLLEEGKYDEAYEIFLKLAEAGQVFEAELKEAEENKTKQHEWISATCTAPETCAVCGVTRGNAPGHEYVGGSCTEPKACARCGQKGFALGHDYSEATCTRPATCRVCNQSTGAPIGHSYEDATCTTPSKCRICGIVNGSKLGHDYSKATCTAPETCTLCGVERGSKLAHDYSEATCTKPATCRRCFATLGIASGHRWREATCTTPQTCAACGQENGSARGHVYANATCTKPAACVNCGQQNGSALGHDYTEATCTRPATCRKCSATWGSAQGHQWMDATYERPMTCRVCYATSGSRLYTRSITNCNSFEVTASTYFSGNAVDVSAGKMIDGDPQSSWDSDFKNVGQFFTIKTGDGKKYEVKGIEIANGKWHSDYETPTRDYYKRNCRIKEMRIYVDGREIGEFTLHDQRYVWEKIEFGPVVGSEFTFEILSVYQGEIQAVCVTEIVFY